MATQASRLPPLTSKELQDNQAPGLYVVFSIFLVLPLAAVALRIVARRVARLPLWWDDWLLIAASAAVIAQYIFLLEAIANGAGQHMEVVPLDHVEAYLMWTYASEIYYAITVTLVKCSVLCLYLRLFGISKAFARTCYGLLVFVAAWGVAVLLSTIFQCTPIAAAWNIATHSDVGTRCIDLRIWLIANNIPNILADVLIISLPMPIIWSLKLSLLRRMGLAVIFLLAFAATIISIVRVTANAKINVEDPTWGYVSTAEYSTIEANTGILTACLPVMVPLVRVCAGRCPLSTSRSAPGDAPGEPSSHDHQKKLSASRPMNSNETTQLGQDTA